MEKEELLPAHKRAIKLLKENPIKHFDTLAEMYQGTIVPVKDVPELLEAFSEAEDRIKKEGYETTVNKVYYILYSLIEKQNSGQMEQFKSE